MRPISAPSSHAHRCFAPLAVAAIVALAGSCLTPPEDVDAAGFGPSNQMTDSGRDLAQQSDAGGRDTGGRDTGPPDSGDTPDQGTPTDTAVDQGEPDLYVPCDGMCGADEFCLETEQRCVECFDDAHCGDDVCTDDNRCVECISTTDCDAGVCDTESNTCVECVTNNDCTDPAASLCDTATNTCTSCGTSADCSHLATPVCDTSGIVGVCVECLDDDDTTRAACGDNSCNPETKLCTQTQTESLATCESCVADSECADTHRCVPMSFDSQFHGNYCLRIRGTTPCINPYTVQLSAMSRSGAPAEPYCGINPDDTTCEAVRDHLAPQICTADENCGAVGVSDGLCRSINLAMRCTYFCTTSSQCPTVCNTATNACAEDL